MNFLLDVNFTLSDFLVFGWLFSLISLAGVIFGIWNSHTSVGNIMGAVIASHYTSTDWSLSFIVPGIIIAISGVVIFLFLPEYPADVGCTSPKKVNQGLNNSMKCSSQPRVSKCKSDFFTFFNREAFKYDTQLISHQLSSYAY